MRKTITVILLIISVLVPFMAFDVLPVIGDPQSAPNTHVSDYYIENAIEECNSPNMVTAVIVDYRAFDTMFETTVMFLAGLSVVGCLHFESFGLEHGLKRIGQQLFILDDQDLHCVPLFCSTFLYYTTLQS